MELIPPHVDAPTFYQRSLFFVEVKDNLGLPDIKWWKPPRYNHMKGNLSGSYNWFSHLSGYAVPPKVVTHLTKSINSLSEASLGKSGKWLTLLAFADSLQGNHWSDSFETIQVSFITLSVAVLTGDFSLSLGSIQCCNSFGK